MKVRPRRSDSNQAAFDRAMARTAGCFETYCDAPHARANARARTPTNGVRSGFLETVADPIQGFDHLEIVVHHLEFLAQPLDVAVDGTIVDIDLVIIGRIHQRVA